MVEVVLLQSLATDRRSYAAGESFFCADKREADRLISHGIAKPLSEKAAALASLEVVAPSLPNIDESVAAKPATPPQAPPVVIDDDDEGAPELTPAGELPALASISEGLPEKAPARRPGRPRKND